MSFDELLSGAEPLHIDGRDILIKVDQERRNHSVHVGLCESCRFVRRIESDRGSIFYLCQRSLTDGAFPKYPRLPVLLCRGYDPLDENHPQESSSEE